MATSYVALLRGINVGGRSIMPMKEIVAIFEELGLANVRTYIASGNVLFESANADPRKLEQQIEKALAKRFAGYDAKVVVRSKQEMTALMKKLPSAWQKPRADTRYNVIFLRHAIDDRSILDQLAPTPGIESVVYAPGALLWSAPTSNLTKTSMIKLSRSPLYKEVTVRSLNTAKKILALMSVRPPKTPAR